jgi:hypothetical protein
MAERADTPHDLIFGLLAVRSGLIDQGALIAALDAWNGGEDRSISAVLLERGAINPTERDLLEGLPARHLVRSNGDPGKALASLGADRALCERVARVVDPALMTTLPFEHATAAEGNGGGPPNEAETLPTPRPPPVLRHGRHAWRRSREGHDRHGRDPRR